VHRVRRDSTTRRPGRRCARWTSASPTRTFPETEGAYPATASCTQGWNSVLPPSASVKASESAASPPSKRDGAAVAVRRTAPGPAGGGAPPARADSTTDNEDGIGISCRSIENGRGRFDCHAVSGTSAVSFRHRRTGKVLGGAVVL